VPPEVRDRIASYQRETSALLVVPTVRPAANLVYDSSRGAHETHRVLSDRQADRAVSEGTKSSPRTFFGRFRRYEKATRNMPIYRHFPMARPGLEPGTPRFSVVFRCRSNLRICRELLPIRRSPWCPGFPDFASFSRALRPMAGLVGLFVARVGPSPGPVDSPSPSPARSRAGGSFAGLGIHAVARDLRPPEPLRDGRRLGSSAISSEQPLFAPRRVATAARIRPREHCAAGRTAGPRVLVSSGSSGLGFRACSSSEALARCAVDAVIGPPQMRSLSSWRHWAPGLGSGAVRSVPGPGRV
jgi:hypothetical protein